MSGIPIWDNKPSTTVTERKFDMNKIRWWVYEYETATERQNK